MPRGKEVMPLYVYYCKDCDKSFEIRHSMNKEDQTCIFCESKEIFKKPFFTIGKKQNTKSESRPVGSVVNSYIEDAKKEIKEEKKSLRERQL